MLRKLRPLLADGGLRELVPPRVFSCRISVRATRILTTCLCITCRSPLWNWWSRACRTFLARSLDPDFRNLCPLVSLSLCVSRAFFCLFFSLKSPSLLTPVQTLEYRSVCIYQTIRVVVVSICQVDFSVQQTFPRRRFLELRSTSVC